MSKNFTLPKELLTATAALSEHEPCELLYETKMVDYLSEEFDNLNFSPKKSTVDRILAYSKAVRVNASTTIVEGVVIPLN